MGIREVQEVSLYVSEKQSLSLIRVFCSGNDSPIHCCFFFHFVKFLFEVKPLLRKKKNDINLKSKIRKRKKRNF